ncbi:MAG: hypothetical protein MUE46_17015 [Xanthomonadales bacterium]|jgi:hypothetical protein|nr:hypothetical protein [Xanthomonadales bacterium]
MKLPRVLLAALAALAGIGLYLALQAGGTPAPFVTPATDPTPASAPPTTTATAADASAPTPEPTVVIRPPTTALPASPAPAPPLPGLHNARSAREALKWIAQQPEGPDSVGHQREVERLCLRARRESRRRESISPDTWYAAHLALRREWCADLPAVEGDPDSVERALLALGPDRGDVLREQLGRSSGDLGTATARRALAQSRDLYELTAALQHLDALGALGVPPWSLREDRPAQLNELSGIAAQWTLCAEAGPCGPRSWPVLRYCAERNSCPPDADYYTAVRLSLGAVQYEQLQWLTRRIAAERVGGRRT